MDLIFMYILILLIPFIAQVMVMQSYAKNKEARNSVGLCGQEVARKILDANGLDRVHIVEVKGTLTDHYDSNQKVVRLSSDVFHGESISSLAIAAHECGHAIQDKERYTWLVARSSLFPVVNFLTYTAYIVFFISILLQAADFLLLSIVLVFISLLFQIVTLPVEFDASKRALAEIDKLELVNKTEKEGTSNVLKAAAISYVASVLSSLLNLIRLLLVMNNRKR